MWSANQRRVAARAMSCELPELCERENSLFTALRGIKTQKYFQQLFTG
jgi:hypothetical protein